SHLPDPHAFPTRRSSDLRKHECDRADGGVLLAEKKSAAKRVLVAQLVARIELDPVRDNVAIHARSDAIEDQIADFIRPEQHGAEIGRASCREGGKDGEEG